MGEVTLTRSSTPQGRKWGKKEGCITQGLWEVGKNKVQDNVTWLHTARL